MKWQQQIVNVLKVRFKWNMTKTKWLKRLKLHHQLTNPMNWNETKRNETNVMDRWICESDLLWIIITITRIILCFTWIYYLLHVYALNRYFMHAHEVYPIFKSHICLISAECKWKIGIWNIEKKKSIIYKCSKIDSAFHSGKWNFIDFEK